jgi:dihydroorotate dehydrogenase electron transfer subunit
MPPHKTYKIKSIRKDSPLINTYILDGGYHSLPGQFVMIWLPSIDEKPMSIAYQDEKETHITVAAIGPFTKELAKKQAGEKLSIRGPYGSAFSLDKGKRYCMVGGGVGVPPLFNTTSALRLKNIEVDFIVGGRSKEHVIFEKELKNIGASFHACTDDGSYGFNGFTPQKLEEMLNAGEKLDAILTCGPEIMMYKVAEIAKKHGVYCEVSMERYMKCGFGVCGACCVDGEGLRMCVEGPVIEGARALSWEEFGKYHRNATGQKI